MVVALLAALSAEGIRLPEGPGHLPVEDPCQAPLPERAVGIAPGSDWKRAGRAVDDMQDMADKGVRWLRLSFEWAVISPAPGEYRWNSVDKIMRQAETTCLSVLAMIGTTPEWARAPGCRHIWCPPADDADWGQFVRAVADRYGGTGIRAWEVWNEQNYGSFFQPRPDPERFGALLEETTRAIRERLPDATILSGGLAPALKTSERRMLPAEYLAELYDTGAMEDVDGVAYHPYSYPNLPSVHTGQNGFIDQLGDMREVMLSNGDGAKDVWLTEYGVPTPGGEPAPLVAGAVGGRRLRDVALPRLRRAVLLVLVAGLGLRVGRPEQELRPAPLGRLGEAGLRRVRAGAAPVSKPVDLILVTGTPRSGTTVVGDVLAEAAGTRYLYEPLNKWVGLREIDEDFPVVGSSSFPPERLADLLGRIARLDLKLKPGVFPHDEGWRRLAKRVSGSRTTMSYRLCRLDPRLRTMVWKDPFALYLAGSVAGAGLPVVVTVRNPWAVAASFKRLSWGFDAADLHRRLTEAGRPPSLDPATLDDPTDPVTNAAIHWTFAHEQLMAHLDEGRDLRLVDLEDIVEQPEAAYRGLYEHVGLRWTPEIAATITERYAEGTGASAAPTSTKPHEWRDRDVSQVNRYWSGILSEEEAERVRRIVGSLWDETRARCQV